ncbi:MAG TPA: DUF2200 domain-containing protein [Polyangiaceae bacterium]|nr:DUF2200 domain-containing protein [Polyangiaceae bacterium]
MEKKPRIFGMSFGSVYPLYLQKAEKKGRTKEEVDTVIEWLTGYSGAQLRRAIDTKVDFETFFAKAPRMNPNAKRITGVVCGVRVEDIADPLMQKIRYLDKLVDELARGKKMESILRGDEATPAPRARIVKTPAGAGTRARPGQGAAPRRRPKRGAA